MYKKKKNVLLVLLCCLSLVLPNFQVLATDTTNEQIETESGDESLPTSSNLEASSVDTSTEVLPSENPVDTQPNSSSTEEDKDITIEGKIDYFYIESPSLSAPATQNIMILWNEDTDSIQDMEVEFQNEHNETVKFKMGNRDGSAFLLTREFSSYETGTYVATQLICNPSDNAVVIDLSSIGIEASFQVTDSYEDDVMDESILQIEEDDSLSDTTEKIESSIQAAQSELPQTRSYSASPTAKNELVVVIDPGHGGTDPGAIGHGVVEKDVNLSISKYLKEELESYWGVTVYLTRSDDTYLGLSERTDIAKSYGADLFVSIHANASTAAGANGAEVYYPNSSYNAEIGASGKETASIIQSKLVALGLADRGIYIRNTENNTLYPDGSLADYYSVIRNSKLNGFPGIIVEHGFISNSSDVSNFLSSESKLKALGVADATAIAESYNLSKTSPDKQPPVLGTPTVVVDKGVATITVSVGDDYGLSHVYFPTWSHANGQDDIRWYRGNIDSQTGIATCVINYNAHSYQSGTYSTHIYAYDKTGNYSLKGINFTIEPSQTPLMSAPTVSIDGSKALIQVEFSSEFSLDYVYFPTWTNANQQDDIIWALGTVDHTTNTATFEVDIKKHNSETGVYQTHIYAYDTLGNRLLKGITYEFPANARPIIGEPTIKIGDEKALISIPISDDYELSHVYFPTWSAENGQDDIKWLLGTIDRSTGVVTFELNIQKYSGDTGLYHTHIYAYDSFGKYASKALKIDIPTNTKPIIESTDVTISKDRAYITAKITDDYKLQHVYFPTWSNEGGQDDIRWLSGKIDHATGIVTFEVDINNYNSEYGLYHTHIYAYDTCGAYTATALSYSINQ